MLEWEHFALLALCMITISIILTLLIRRRFCSKKPTDIAAVESNGTEKIDFDGKRRGNYYVFRRGITARPLFSWSDHPTLITDAVENGWSRFGFTGFMPSPAARPSLLGLCAAGDGGRGEAGPEISWEVCQGSADFMQKIRLNSGLKRINSTNNHFSSAVSVIRTALPLPGPPLGNSAFPQEAYFEITILCSEGDDEIEDGNLRIKEGEKIKLIEGSLKENVNSESVIHVSDSRRFGDGDEGKVGVRDQTVAVSLGLTTGGSMPLKLLGSYPGSVGFNSDGSVYLDGIKLLSESPEKGSGWAKKNRVIGCGYDPRQKKVFFTVDAELVQVINCKTEEFGTPLYPTIAANIDTTVLVNFGQSSFSYGPANAQRTPNPCFIGPFSSSALGYEDSKELFSMGRIDSQWHCRSVVKSSLNLNNHSEDLGEESEADLFEIVIEGNNSKSPNIVL